MQTSHSKTSRKARMRPSGKRAATLLALATTMGLLAPTIAQAQSEEDVATGVHASFPFLGVTAEVQKVSEGDGFSLRATVDGKDVDLEKLASDEARARRERLGALDPALAVHLEKLADDDRVPVALWLAEAERALGKRPKDGAKAADVDAILERQTGRRAEEVAALTQPWTDRLREFDTEPTASTTSPVIWASLPVKVIRELATDERIDTIYGDLEKGGPDTNLSRRVVGADFAPAAGLNGSGVQVGVVESGGLADPRNPFLYDRAAGALVLELPRRLRARHRRRGRHRRAIGHDRRGQPELPLEFRLRVLEPDWLRQRRTTVRGQLVPDRREPHASGRRRQLGSPGHQQLLLH